jgi:hypothetical protein
MRGGDEGGKKASDASRGQGESRPMKTLRGETRTIEIHSGKTIHLWIEKT